MLLLILAAAVSGALVTVLPTWDLLYAALLGLHPLLGLAAAVWILGYMRRHLSLWRLALCALGAVLGGVLLSPPWMLPAVGVVHFVLLLPYLLRGPAWVTGTVLFAAWQLCLASGLGQLMELWRGGSSAVAASHLGLGLAFCAVLSGLLALVHRRSLTRMLPAAALVGVLGAGNALWPWPVWSLRLDSRNLSAERLANRDRLPVDALSLQESCMGCHAEAVHSASLSAHAISTRTPHYQAVRGLAIAEAGAKAGDSCDACHAPQALLGSSDAAGLACTACHLAQGVRNEEEASWLTLGAPPHLSTFLDAQGREHAPGRAGVTAILLSPLRHAAAFQAPVLSEDALCISCHRDQIAPSVMVGLQPIQCAECHLQGADHFMPGANAALTRHADAPESAERLLAWVSGAEAVRVRGWEYLWVVRDATDDLPTSTVWLTLFHEDLTTARRGASYAFRVQSSNVGAPHAFPSGDLSMSEAWLDLRVVDASGAVLFATPGLGADGRLPADAVRLGGALLDADGAPITEYRVWDAVESRVDSAIPGGRHRNDDFTMEIPPDAEGPLQVSGTWRYRKMSPDFAEWAYGDPTGIPEIALGKLEHAVRLR